MIGKELRQSLRFKPEEDKGIKRKPPKVLIWIIIAAIVFLAFTDFTEWNKKNESNPDTEEKEDQVNTDISEYVSQLEMRLTEALKKINGAGNVSVFINIDNGGEKILATDKKNKENTEENEGQTRENQQETEENIVLSGQSSGQNPYVVEELLPRPVGVLVIAEGARDENVRYEIYEAVKAIFGLSAHRIKVTY